MAAKSRAEPTQIVVVVDDVLTLSCYASYLKAVRASVTAEEGRSQRTAKLKRNSPNFLRSLQNGQKRRITSHLDQTLRNRCHVIDKFNKLRLLCNVLVNIIYIVESKSNKKPPIEMCFALTAPSTYHLPVDRLRRT